MLTDVKAGEIKYINYGDKPVIHRVWNEGLDTFKFLVVELLKPHRANDSCKMHRSPNPDLQLQNKLVCGYRMIIPKSDGLNLPGSGCAEFLIVVNGEITINSPGRMQAYHSGDFVFFPPHSKINITGGSRPDANCVILHLH